MTVQPNGQVNVPPSRNNDLPYPFGVRRFCHGPGWGGLGIDEIRPDEKAADGLGAVPDLGGHLDVLAVHQKIDAGMGLEFSTAVKAHAKLRDVSSGDVADLGGAFGVGAVCDVDLQLGGPTEPQVLAFSGEVVGVGILSGGFQPALARFVCRGHGLPPHRCLGCRSTTGSIGIRLADL